MMDPLTTLLSPNRHCLLLQAKKGERKREINMEAVVNKFSLASFVHSDHLHTNFSRNHGLSFVHAPAAKSRRSLPKLQISNSRRACGIIACLNGKNEKNDLDPSQSTSNAEEARIDIGLPRRSLLVKFTCDACGERTSRFINRIAYEKGTVFLQAVCLLTSRRCTRIGRYIGPESWSEISGH